MKRYLHECNGCVCKCRLALRDALAVPQGCIAKGGVSSWKRMGEFEQWEEAPGEIERWKAENEKLRAKCLALGDANAGLEKESIYLKEKYSSLVDWIEAFLGLGVQGLKTITGRKVEK